MYLFHGSIAGVLAGAIWGDHCSPISDTTVLSSLASECDHIEHVRTQLPYAMTSGLLAIALCTLPTGLGVPWWLCLPISFAAIIAILKFVGKPVERNLKNA
jgi:Na+/H+ antiporter NhaC